MSYAGIVSTRFTGGFQPSWTGRALRGFGALDPSAISTGKYCGSARNIQVALNDLGYGPLGVDGILGQKSYAAMDKFGRAVGVGAVQYATPAFCAALQSALAALVPPPPPDPDPGQPPPQQSPPQSAPPQQNPPQAQPPAGQPPATGITGWWNGLSTGGKIGVGVGGVAVLGILAFLVMSGDDDQAPAAAPAMKANRRHRRRRIQRGKHRLRRHHEQLRSMMTERYPLDAGGEKWGDDIPSWEAHFQMRRSHSPALRLRRRRRADRSGYDQPLSTRKHRKNGPIVLIFAGKKKYQANAAAKRKRHIRVSAGVRAERRRVMNLHHQRGLPLSQAWRVVKGGASSYWEALARARLRPRPRAHRRRRQPAEGGADGRARRGARVRALGAGHGRRASGRLPHLDVDCHRHGRRVSARRLGRVEARGQDALVASWKGSLIMSYSTVYLGTLPSLTPPGTDPCAGIPGGVPDPQNPKWCNTPAKSCLDSGGNYDGKTCTHVSTEPAPSWLLPVVVVSVVGILGFAMWYQYKVVTSIADKEGSSGVLKYEAGTALIGLAAEAGHRGLSQNRRRGRRFRGRGV